MSSLTDSNPFSGDPTLPNISAGVTAEVRVKADNDNMVEITIVDT